MVVLHRYNFERANAWSVWDAARALRRSKRGAVVAVQLPSGRLGKGQGETWVKPRRFLGIRHADAHVPCLVFMVKTV